MISKTRNLSGSLPIEIQRFGDWERVALLIPDLPLLIAAGSRSGQKSAAEKIRHLVKQNIRNQGVQGGPRWPSLKQSYIETKAREGLDTRIYLRTGLYHRSITIWEKNGVYYVGVKRGVRASGSKTKTIGYIAQILERGLISRNIPARPLWAPTFKQFGGNKRIRSIIVWHIANLVYLRHGVKVKIY